MKTLIIMYYHLIREVKQRSAPLTFGWVVAGETVMKKMFYKKI
jgi:hypothetical protein